MNQADIADLLKLPAEERMRLIELLWESLAAEPGALPLADAQRTVLDERLSEHERTPDDVLTVAQAIAGARRGR
jgi:putative addiction module component (TIGR02574 family)